MVQANIRKSVDANAILDAAFLLANAACTDSSEHFRAAARYELGCEVLKNPRLAAPLTREILDMRNSLWAIKHAVYSVLLTVLENGLGRNTHHPTIIKIAETACFNNNSLDRAIAGWAILRNMEETL